MFKINNFENELYKTMETTLVANQVEASHGFNKLAKAVEYLSKAAELFDDAQMHSESEEISNIINSFASSVKSKPSKEPQESKQPKKPIDLQLYQGLNQAQLEKLLEIVRSAKNTHIDEK